MQADSVGSPERNERDKVWVKCQCLCSVAVAAIERVICVPESICEMIVPGAMPVPDTNMPTTSSAVAARPVTEVEPLVSVPLWEIVNCD